VLEESVGGIGEPEGAGRHRAGTVPDQRTRVRMMMPRRRRTPSVQMQPTWPTYSRPSRSARSGRATHAALRSARRVVAARPL
jgi:hypothetical protein